MELGETTFGTDCKNEIVFGSHANCCNVKSSMVIIMALVKRIRSARKSYAGA